MKEKLLELLEQNDRGYTSEELAQLLNIQGSAQYTKLIRQLNALEDELEIARDERDRYHLAKDLGYYLGP